MGSRTFQPRCSRYGNTRSLSLGWTHSLLHDRPDGGVVTHSVLATLYNGDVTGTPKIPLVFAVVVARVSMQFLLIVLFVFRPIKSIGSIGRHFDIVAPQSYLSFTGFLALVFLLVFESDLDIAVVVGNVEGMHSVDGYKSVYGIVDCGGHIAIAGPVLVLVWRYFCHDKVPFWFRSAHRPQKFIIDWVPSASC